uniref:Contactin-4-like n=1 Tax=Labrus bergylta TaxID=56723 RepID=A0A3Q3EZR3_9LABR
MSMVQAKEGQRVTLNTREDGCDSKVEVVWIFGPEKPVSRVARMRNRVLTTNYTKSFGNRLKLDPQSGSLSITELRSSDSGVYMCQSIGVNILSQQFNLIVYAGISQLHLLKSAFSCCLPASVCTPSIRTNMTAMNSHCSWLTVECSVKSSRELRLSMFRGRDKLKETSRPDPSSTLHLSLLISKGDEGEYSCVAENPVDQKSSRLHTADTCLNNGGMMMLKLGNTVLLFLSLLLVLLYFLVHCLATIHQEKFLVCVNVLLKTHF